MSGEFRAAYGPYMHGALEQAAGEPGRHPVSHALAELYAAVQPVEEAAAWFEAYDSGWDAPALALIERADAIEAAAAKLMNQAAQYRGLAAAAIRKAEADDDEL
ncbi:MAG TPA: hypothetical protein PKY87_12810 [Terricaulis sp.]|nr:hypothetical protein [Terricaulis sp.]